MMDYNSDQDDDESTIVSNSSQELEEQLYELDSSDSSEFDDYTDTESEDDEPDIYETIYLFDQEFVESDKQTETYYITSVHLQRDTHIMAMPISCSAFFAFPFPRVLRYLYIYSGILGVPKKSIEIVKLDVLADGTHQCTIKTHWLRLVQRHWRKIYQQRETVIATHMQLSQVESVELNGKKSDNANVLPSYRGLLSQYRAL